jgi:hypothetical protein
MTVKYVYIPRDSLFRDASAAFEYANHLNGHALALGAKATHTWMYHAFRASYHVRNELHIDWVISRYVYKPDAPQWMDTGLVEAPEEWNGKLLRKL